MKTKKSRCFTIVLYPDCEKDLNTLHYIIDHYDYAYIAHTKDIFLNDVFDKDHKLIHKAGDLKKSHIHCLFYFPNPRSVDNIKEELNIDYIEASSFYPMCRYLIHLDHRQKYQYQASDIITNMPVRVYNCLSKEVNFNDVNCKLLFSYLSDNQFSISFAELTKYAFENDCIQELKKNCYFYKSFCAF